MKQNKTKQKKKKRKTCTDCLDTKNLIYIYITISQQTKYDYVIR